MANLRIADQPSMVSAAAGFYDKDGKPTEALKIVWRRIDQQREIDAENAELAAKFPSCNSQYATGMPPGLIFRLGQHFF